MSTIVTLREAVAQIGVNDGDRSEDDDTYRRLMAQFSGCEPRGPSESCVRGLGHDCRVEESIPHTSPNNKHASLADTSTRVDSDHLVLTSGRTVRIRRCE